jgi:hypothetical protein
LRAVKDLNREGVGRKRGTMKESKLEIETNLEV